MGTLFRIIVHCNNNCFHFEVCSFTDDIILLFIKIVA